MTRMHGIARDQLPPSGRHPYLAPSARPRDLQFAGPGSSQIIVQAIEVCQAIQTVESSVTLIADKATLVRVLSRSSRPGSACPIDGGADRSNQSHNSRDLRSGNERSDARSS